METLIVISLIVAVVAFGIYRTRKQSGNGGKGISPIGRDDRLDDKKPQ